MKYQIKKQVSAVLENREWNQRDLTEALGCGKNSLKSWLDCGAPRYIVLALERLQITNGKASCFAIVSNSPSDWRAFRNILKYAKRDLAKFEGKQK